MDARILDSRLYSRIVSAEEAAEFIKDGMTVAMSGYAMAGYPKAVVNALVERKINDPQLSFHLITGANVPWLDDQLGGSELLFRRTPMCASKLLAKQANDGTLNYVEQQMNKMPRLLRSGSFGSIDVAVVEALGFDESGALIPTSSIGMTPHVLAAAKKIIIEINTAQPEILGQLHDIYIPQSPPYAEPIPLVRVNQRIGKAGIPIDHGKIQYIVETHIHENHLGAPSKGTPETLSIAQKLCNFLEIHIAGKGGWLPPVQTGFGNIADAVVETFQQSNFKNLQFFCGGITEPVLELLFSGKASAISTGGVGMSKRVTELLTAIPQIRDHLVLRNGDLTNNAEIIGRLGLIALNSGIEMDIYGNVNASHIGGSRVVNGIGGGANFAQNAGLSVILMPSIAKGGAISNIVPMVSHQDICEHDVDIVVTENGLADLRGLDDGERADMIISQCTSGAYQEQLRRYLKAARNRCGGHHPQLPEEAFQWYRRLKEEKTMVERNL